MQVTKSLWDPTGKFLTDFFFKVYGKVQPLLDLISKVITKTINILV